MTTAFLATTGSLAALAPSPRRPFRDLLRALARSLRRARSRTRAFLRSRAAVPARPMPRDDLLRLAAALAGAGAFLALLLFCCALLLAAVLAPAVASVAGPLGIGG